MRERGIAAPACGWTPRRPRHLSITAFLA